MTGSSPPRSARPHVRAALLPTRRSTATRSPAASLGCSAIGISPISSRNRVPPCGLLEHALPVGRRAGERAAHVAEQLALHQVLGDRAAVHRDRGARRAAASGVQRARHHVLAGAGLALDQDGRVAGRDRARGSRRGGASRRLRRPARRTRSGPESLDERRLVAEVHAERRAADPHQRPRRDLGLAHAHAVDQRAVRAAAVADHDRLAAHRELAVEARHRAIVQDEIVGVGGADARDLAAPPWRARRARGRRPRRARPTRSGTARAGATRDVTSRAVTS